MKKAQLIIGRDRAHLGELSQFCLNAQELLTANAFFDRVRDLAFIGHEALVRDDEAVLIFAQSSLLETKLFSVSLAPNFVRLYSSFYHGLQRPSEAFLILKNEAHDFVKVLKILHLIDEKMRRFKLCNGVSALYEACFLMKEGKIYPPTLWQKEIIFCDLADLTNLEIEVIKALSRLGFKITVIFSLDFARRSFNVAVDYCAKKFEQDEDLVNIEIVFESLAKDGIFYELANKALNSNESLKLSKKICGIKEVKTIEQEAQMIAQQIAEIKQNKPEASVCLSVRTIDDKSQSYKQALLALGLNVKDRKGQALTESPAGQMLKVIFSLLINHTQKSDFLAIVFHPISKLNTSKSISAFNSMLKALGIDDRLLFGEKKLFSRFKILERAKKIWHLDEDKIALVELCQNKINELEQCLKQFKLMDNFLGHTDALIYAVQNLLIESEPSKEIVLEKLIALKQSASYSQNAQDLSLRDFAQLIEKNLAMHTIANPDNDDAWAVEFLALPELLGRNFDHLFIADMVFGRLPQNLEADILLSDNQRLKINSLLKKDVLRVYLDDPFEPLMVPPRQALEPFWFISAIAASRKTINFSMAQTDFQGKEQVKSEFFLWLNKHVVSDEEEPPISNFVSQDFISFLNGSELNEKNDYWLSVNERKQAFKSEEAGAFSGRFDSEEIIKLFEGRLGGQALKPLTPTMLESLSKCPFNGLLSRILGIKTDDYDKDEQDSRIIGQLAHLSLEKIFGPEKADLNEVVDELSKEFIDNNLVINTDIFACQIEWLKILLAKLVAELTKNGFLKANLVEVPFGFNKKWPGLAFCVNEKKYLLGGVVDRIDFHGNKLIVVDYKLGSIANLRINANEDGLLKNNFQIPIYLLLASNYVKNFDEVEFFYASIKDGKLYKAFDSQKNKEFWQKLKCSTNDSLMPIKNLIANLEEGLLLAKPGEHCDFCDFQYICRKKEYLSYG